VAHSGYLHRLREVNPGMKRYKRTLLVVAVMSLAGSLLSRGQSVTSAEPPAQARTYHLLREDDDWSFLADPTKRNDVWDRIKYIPLNSTGNWYMSVGGETRQVWEQIANDNWGLSRINNGYFNQRYMLHFDIHYGQHVRTFIEFKSGLNSFRVGGPRPIDEKKLDFQAGFLEVKTSDEQNSIALRVGRQELEYGSGRLIDVREGPNVRLSFDGFLVRSKIDSWQVDGFAMRPDKDKPGFFDNSPNSSVGFWGIYATRPVGHKSLTDLYYLGLDRKNAVFERGAARELRHSIGARVSRPVATDRAAWDFDYEALWQFGSFGPDNIRAWTVASETGYRIPTMPLKPRFSVKADISSGDHPGSHSLGTFNALFPKGNYFGVLATTGPGPINFIDLHPRVETSFPHDVSVSFDWILQWRESLRDGVYAVPGFLIVPSGNSRERFVGHRPGTEIHWQIDRHLWVQADYGIFYAGKFLKEQSSGRNLNYWALWAGYKF
jgi:Alginate export